MKLENQERMSYMDEGINVTVLSAKHLHSNQSFPIFSLF